MGAFDDTFLLATSSLCFSEMSARAEERTGAWWIAGTKNWLHLGNQLLSFEAQLSVATSWDGWR
jgi:hypothetical protein